MYVRIILPYSGRLTLARWTRVQHDGPGLERKARCDVRGGSGTTGGLSSRHTRRSLGLAY